MRTESNHIHNTAELEAYKACGFEEYEFVASLGERTCEFCGALDGKRFKLSDKVFGENFPPVHPNCRCTTVAVDPDEVDEDFKGNEGGEKLSYEEWKKTYVEGRNNEIPKITTDPLDISGESGIIKTYQHEGAYSSEAASLMMNSANVFTIADKKIEGFCLNKGSKHYIEFENVGFTDTDGDILKEQLKMAFVNGKRKLTSITPGNDIKFSIDVKLGRNNMKMFRTA